MRFVYKDIHFGAIATFYIIALLVRLITILVFNKFPSIETNYALQVSASLATGLGPAIGALVAMLIFKRRTEYTLIGKSAWKSIATIVIPCIVFGIIGGWDLGVTCLHLRMVCWKNMVGEAFCNTNSGNYLCGNMYLLSQ